MVERLVQHAHCRMCGKATQVDEEFCSEKCEEEHKTLMKKKKRQYYILLAVAVGMMLISMILLYSRG